MAPPYCNEVSCEGGTRSGTRPDTSLQKVVPRLYHIWKKLLPHEELTARQAIQPQKVVPYQAVVPDPVPKRYRTYYTTSLVPAPKVRTTPSTMPWYQAVVPDPVPTQKGCATRLVPHLSFQPQKGRKGGTRPDTTSLVPVPKSGTTSGTRPWYQTIIQIWYIF